MQSPQVADDFLSLPPLWQLRKVQLLTSGFRRTLDRWASQQRKGWDRNFSCSSFNCIFNYIFLCYFGLLDCENVIVTKNKFLAPYFTYSYLPRTRFSFGSLLSLEFLDDINLILCKTSCKLATQFNAKVLRSLQAFFQRKPSYPIAIISLYVAQISIFFSLSEIFRAVGTAVPDKDLFMQ